MKNDKINKIVDKNVLSTFVTGQETILQNTVDPSMQSFFLLLSYLQLHWCFLLHLSFGEKENYYYKEEVQVI